MVLGVFELAFEGLAESFFILWPFVLGDWEWYYQIGGFLIRVDMLLMVIKL